MEKCVRKRGGGEIEGDVKRVRLRVCVCVCVYGCAFMANKQNAEQ